MIVSFSSQCTLMLCLTAIIVMHLSQYTQAANIRTRHHNQFRVAASSQTSIARCVDSVKKACSVLQIAADGADPVAEIPEQYVNLLWEKRYDEEKYRNKEKEVNQFRVDEVAGVLKQARFDNGADRCPTCEFLSCGTVGFGSDYDITVTGPQAHEIVAHFNRIFENKWKKTSAEVFDTNIYGVGWLYCSGTFKSECFKDANIPDVPLVTLEGHKTESVGRSFALAKIRYYLMKAQSSIFPAKSNGCKEDAFTKRNPAICAAWTDFEDKVKAMIDKKSKTFDYEWQASATLLQDLVTQPCKMIKGLCGNKQMIDMDSIATRNRMYEHMLNALLPEFDRQCEIPSYKQCRKLTTMTSTAMFYGIETYYDRATFLNVVSQQQSRIPVELKNEQYFDSFLENLADFIKELSHSHHAEWDHAKFLEKSSKYLSRTVAAFLQTNTEPIGKIKKADLNSLQHFAETMYKGFRGKESVGLVDRWGRKYTLERIEGSLLYEGKRPALNSKSYQEYMLTVIYNMSSELIASFYRQYYPAGDKALKDRGVRERPFEIPLYLTVQETSKNECN